MYRLLEKLLSAVDDLNSASGALICHCPSDQRNDKFFDFINRVKGNQYDNIDDAYRDLAAILGDSDTVTA